MSSATEHPQRRWSIVSTRYFLDHGWQMATGAAQSIALHERRSPQKASLHRATAGHRSEILKNLCLSNNAGPAVQI